MKKTFKELNVIDLVVGDLYRNNESLRQTKFGYAYKKFSDKNYIPTFKAFKDDLLMVRIDHALEDEVTKEVLRDELNPRGYKYSKQGLKDVIKAENDLQELYFAKEIDVTPYISSYIPEQLTEEERLILSGLLIEEVHSTAQPKEL